jgi:microtubule-associated protein 1 light chain
MKLYRNRMQLNSTQAFYLIINNRSMANMTKTLAEIYKENKDEDGFLYVTYASQEMFGSLDDNTNLQLCRN